MTGTAILQKFSSKGIPTGNLGCPGTGRVLPPQDRGGLLDVASSWIFDFAAARFR